VEEVAWLVAHRQTVVAARANDPYSAFVGGLMHSSQPRSNAERAATAESAAAYQKYVVQPAVAPVKNKVHDTKETVQVAAEHVTQQAKAKADEVTQQAQVKAGEVKQQAKAAAEEGRQQAQAKANRSGSRLTA
jgi:hypothetical protein